MKKLSCHCGALEAEVNVPEKFEKVMRCNCSICKRKGYVMSPVGENDMKIIKGEDKLTLYQYYTNTAKHFFCLAVENTRSINKLDLKLNKKDKIERKKQNTYFCSF